jgi:carboxyl-terminal processing protease
MRKLIFVFALVFSLASATAQNRCKEARAIFNLLKTYNLFNRPLDDQLLRKIVDEYAKMFDGQHRAMSQEAYEEILSHMPQLRKDLADGTCGFVEATYPILARQFERAFEFYSSDTFIKAGYNPEAVLRMNPSDYLPQAELPTRWLGLVQSNTLKYYFDNTPEPSEQDFIARYKDIRKFRQDSTSCAWPEAPTVNQYYDYLSKSVAHVFDNHTDFFSISEQEAYEASLSSEGYSIGIVPGYDSFDRLIVQHVQRGSEAYHAGIVVGDQIIRVLADSQTFMGHCLGFKEIERLFFAKDPKEVTLVLRLAKGGMAEYTLKKELATNEFNQIYGAVLNGNNKIGYVVLPGFYSSLISEGGTSSSSDIARHIYQLQQQGIQGLILDLRGNGGGSVLEAMQLIGLFVDQGPLLQIKEIGRAPELLQDRNRGVLYRGPLMVLVDESSASASELVALALQDLGRAVVVGTRTTGKATGQVIMPVIEGFDMLGGLKVTLGAYYSLKGNSPHGHGVTPDIRLPGIWLDLDTNDPIPPITALKHAKKLTSANWPLEQLRQKSEERVNANEKFSELQKVQSVLEQLMGPTGQLALTYPEYYEYYHLFDGLNKDLESMPFVVDHILGDYGRDELEKALLNDFYLHEAWSIFQDYFER